MKDIKIKEIPLKDNLNLDLSVKPKVEVKKIIDAYKTQISVGITKKF